MIRMHRLAVIVILFAALGVGCGAGAAGETRSLQVSASAYNSVASQTEGHPALGAWEDELRPGMKAIAVSPDLIELALDRGTEVTIEGLPGRYTVLDKTASTHTNRIDIYMGTDVEAAREWGVKTVTITWQASE